MFIIKEKHHKIEFLQNKKKGEVLDMAERVFSGQDIHLSSGLQTP